MQSLAGRVMISHGYSLEPVRFTASERLRFYALGWPINLIRMLSWFALEMLQQSFPSRFRRRLPVDKMSSVRRRMREGGPAHG
jgi:hypothetical protein